MTAFFGTYFSVKKNFDLWTDQRTEVPTQKRRPKRRECTISSQFMNWRRRDRSKLFHLFCHNAGFAIQTKACFIIFITSPFAADLLRYKFKIRNDSHRSFRNASKLPCNSDTVFAAMTQFYLWWRSFAPPLRYEIPLGSSFFGSAIPTSYIFWFPTQDHSTWDSRLDLFNMQLRWLPFSSTYLQRVPFSTHLFSPFLACRAIPNICHSSVNIALVCSNTRGQEIAIPSCIREIVDIGVLTVRRLFQEGKCL